MSAFLNRMLSKKKAFDRGSAASTASSIRTNLSVQSIRDNRSASVASVHYSVASLTSVASGLSHCSDFGFDDNDEPVELTYSPESVHNAHSKRDCTSIDNGMNTNSGSSIYGNQSNQDQKEQDLDDLDNLDIDQMMTSIKLMELQLNQSISELKQLNHSIKAMELEQQTLKAENQRLRAERGGPISQNDYRQHIGFWDGDLKRTVQGIDVVPIYNLNNASAGYICVGVPVAAHHMYHRNVYIPPYTWQQRTHPR